MVCVGKVRERCLHSWQIEVFPVGRRVEGKGIVDY